MKQLVCEMCGSTDLMKQDGVFVCQSCGTKYSVEEAKKMMFDVLGGDSGSVDTVATTKKDEKEHKQTEQAEKESDGQSHKEDVGDTCPIAEKQGQEEGTRIAKRIKIIAIIATSIICAIIAVVVLLNTIIIPNVKFLKQKDGLSNVTVGSTIKLGFYEQDNNAFNGKEEIEWFVIEVDDSRALLLSKYGLDGKPYDANCEIGGEVTWETCTLRKWLNNDFINSAFSAKGRAMIPTEKVLGSTNPITGIRGGNHTYDQIFLLDIFDCFELDSSIRHQCEPTDYAVANGAWDGDKSFWWLRSPGRQYDFAAAVDYDSMDCGGRHVDHSAGTVRPALWIDLNA